MINVPRWLTLGVVWCFAVFTVVFGLVVLTGRPHPLSTAGGLVLFAAAVIASLGIGRADRVAAARPVVATAIGVVLPLTGMPALDPATDSFSNGTWFLSGVLCLHLQLLLNQRVRLAWLVLGAFVVEMLVWSGPWGLLRFGVLATLLVVGVLTVSAWAIGVTGEEIERYSASEREAATWRAAQDAFHSERQVRLATTALVAAPMLRRIVELRGRLGAADRAECRLLEQTIRDEIRGRRLLNRAVREQVMLHRRRGAAVQVNDDGGLDDLDPAALDAMLNRVAEAVAGLGSDRIVIRTAPRDSDTALSVVAMSVDPTAAALGLDDGDDRVDLWLELPRPVA